MKRLISLISLLLLFFLPLKSYSNNSNIIVTPITFSFGAISRNDIKYFEFTVKNYSSNIFSCYTTEKPEAITTDPIYSFMLRPNEEQLVKCILNPQSLNPGSYQYTFIVGYEQGKVEITVTFTILPYSSVLVLSEEIVDFGIIKNDNYKEKQVTIKNLGEENLSGEIFVDSDWLEVSHHLFNISKLDSIVVNIKATKIPATLHGLVNGLITVKSTKEIKRISVKGEFLTEVLIKLAINSNIAYKNFDKIILDSPATIIKGRTMVPLRFISEAFNAIIEWNQTTRKINIFYPVKKVNIVLQIGNYKAFIEKTEIQLETPPILVNNRTLVPIRFIGEAFGANVEWESNNQRITITLLY